MWPGGAILAGLAAICTALVAVTHAVTAPRIAANEQAFLEQSLQPVLQGIDYDGKLSESTLVIPAPHELPGDDPVTIYRVYADSAPIAVHGTRCRNSRRQHVLRAQRVAPPAKSKWRQTSSWRALHAR